MASSRKRKSLFPLASSRPRRNSSRQRGLSGKGRARILRIESLETRLVLCSPAGDYDGSGTVGPEDYLVWRNNFGSTTELAADGNGNLVIDAADFTIWRDNLGAVSTCAPGEFDITSPTGALADKTPTITWEAAHFADSYELHISNGTNVVQSHTGLATTFLTLTTPLAAGNYFTYVVAKNDNGMEMASNSGLPFTVADATISTVYFAQSHVQKPSDPLFGLVSNRDALIKAHVVAPGSPAAPEVTATLTLHNQTLVLPLTGPDVLPASIPDGPGVVQHSFTNTFTAIIPSTWMHPDLDITVTADMANVAYNNLEIGAPTVVDMTMFDVQYFADTNGDYPAGTLEEIEAKWPVADLIVTRVPHVVFPELVIPPRPDVGTPAVRVSSPAEYLAQTGLPFDGEQAAALAWNGALKRAAGRSGRVFLSYVNIYGANAGGQAGGFAGVGNGTSAGILHHELGHALSLPHWGGNASYPYNGPMFGINQPSPTNPTHAGPTWAFDLPTMTFIPPTTQPGNVGNHPVGTFKVDPMQGGGTGYQESGFLLNHFSDYSMNQMRNYLEGHVLEWNESLGRYASWNQSARDYTNAVTNNGIRYPVERDVEVISILASISGSNQDVNMVYPPIGPYQGGLIDLFDPRSASDRAEARSDYGSSADFDVSLRIIQGGVEKIYMLPASWQTGVSPLSSSSLITEALNLPAADGEVTRVDMLLTPNAHINGLPANPQVLNTWAPVQPDPASFAVPPTAGGSTAITMRATTGVSTGDPVEYLFTELTGNPGATSSGWQSSPNYTDINLQPSTQYAYTVTTRAGSYTGQASAPIFVTTNAAGSVGNITYDGFASWDRDSDPGTFNASGSDKLVVIVSGEHNFPGNYSGDVVNVTYNGQALSKVVDVSPNEFGHGQTAADIWFLDNPGNYAGSGTIDVTFNGNNWVVTAIGLSGTAAGFGATANVTGTSSVNLTTVGENSVVIASVGMGGMGNTATPLPGITGNAPLTTVDALEIGSNWAGHAVGRATIASPSSSTFSFNTTRTDVVTIAAEFLAAPVGSASLTLPTNLGATDAALSQFASEPRRTSFRPAQSRVTGGATAERLSEASLLLLAHSRAPSSTDVEFAEFELFDSSYEDDLGSDDTSTDIGIYELAFDSAD